MHIFKRLLLICVIVPCAALQAQRMRFEQLSVADGLSHTTVFRVLQDSKGTILICTANGLNKYDGYDFTVFYADQSDSTALSNDNVSAMVEGSDGNVWVGTWGGGLHLFNVHTERFRHFEADLADPKRLSDGRIQAMFQHKGSSSVWVGTFAGGLNKYMPGTGEFTRYAFDEKDPYSLSNNRVWSICDGGNGRIFIGTSHGLNLLDTASKTMERFYIDPKASPKSDVNQIRAVHRMADGRLWVGTEQGLYWFDAFTKAFIEVPQPFTASDRSINCFYEYPEGILWIGTQRSGLMRYDTHTGFSQAMVHSNGDMNSLADNDVRHIYVDRSNVMWVSTRAAGISKLPLGLRKFERYGTEDGLSDRHVLSLMQDNMGNIWAGTLLAGVTIFSPTGKKTYLRNEPSNPNSLVFNEVHQILQDHAGQVWLATERGLDRYDPKRKQFTHFQHNAQDSGSVASNVAQVIYEDMTGRIWLGTKDQGIQYYDDAENRWRRVPISENIYAKRINGIAEGPARVLWVATDAGLYCIQTKDSIVVSAVEAMAKYSVRTLYKPAGDEIWLGTSHGLVCYDTKKQSVTEALLAKDGLPSNQIDAILPDNAGKLWISSGRGLTRYSPNTGQLRNYDQSDGLQSNVFNMNAAYRSPTGRLFFGGINGFNAFFPSEITDRDMPPPVRITGFSKMGKEVLFDKPVDEVEEIVLQPNETVFSFKFAALDYVNPAKNEYAYRLDGIDDEWIYCGNNRVVTYSHLPPGEYTFRVKGSNSDKVWNEEGKSVRIRIVPPFWQEPWFMLGAALFVTFGIGLGVMLRLSYLQKMRRRLEAEVKERTKQLMEEKDKLSLANTQITENLDKISAQRDEIEAQRNDILQKHARLEKALDEIQQQNQAIREQKSEIEQKQQKLEEAQAIIEQKNTQLLEANHLLEDKVEQRTQELDRAYKDLLRTHKQLDHFTYRSAHDLKGPIARLLGLCYLGKFEVKGEKALDYLSRLEQTAKEMNILLNRLMRAHEVKTKPVEETRFALRPLVNHIVKEVQLIDPSVKIEAAIPDHLMLYTDHALTHIMLENLLENAMQYQRHDEANKKVRITAKMAERGQLSLVVEDNGIGIPVEVADQVFEMFVVGSSQSKGAGLGLYEASVIADRLGGKVWLKEYGAHKTIFEVMLPVGG